MKVSVIIINYNTLELTNECINSIFNYSCNISFEVIVVDNHSVDGSLEFFSKDSRIIYIYLDDNLGFGRANNIGYSKSKGEYVFFLNSDTILKNDALSIFLNKFQMLPENIGCLGCILRDTNGLNSHSYGRFPTVWGVFQQFIMNDTFKIKCDKSHYLDYKGVPEDYFEVDYVTGADLFVKRNTIEDFGLFDENFFMYYEETDLQRRYSQHGLKSIIINGPIIIHLEGGSSKKKTPNLKRISLFYISGFIYLKKWSSPLSYYMLKIVFYLTRFIQLLLNPKFTLKDKLELIKNLHR